MKNTDDPGRVIVTTANAADRLRVTLYRTPCGAIEDGVGFAHFVDRRTVAGGWVIALRDLRAIVERADALRTRDVRMECGS